MTVQKNDETAAKAVTLSQEELEQAVRLLERLVEPSAHFATDQEGISSSEFRDLAWTAKLVQLVRNCRHRYFAPCMFGEPAWDLLIGLYIGEGSQQSVTTLAKEAGVPTSTALRWLDYLEERKLVSRCAGTQDKRTIGVTLSSKGREALEAYLSEVSEGLLPRR